MKKKKKCCFKCGMPIAFKQLASGMWCPTNLDGSDHWDTCRAVVNFTRGGFDPTKDMKTMAITVGENYRPTPSSALPWEDE